MLLGFWKFSKSSMCSDDYLGNSSWKAYFSEQEIQDEREKYELSHSGTVENHQGYYQNRRRAVDNPRTLRRLSPKMRHRKLLALAMGFLALERKFYL